MRIAVAPLQVSRSLPPVPIPVVTPVMVDRVVNIHHSQVFHTDSPLKQQSEQKLKQLESRITNLEKDSPQKSKVEKLLEENERLQQLVREKTENASKYKGELLTAKKEISKYNDLYNRLKKVLDLKEEALTDMRIKSQSRSISRASERKTEQLIQEKQLLEQQFNREKQQWQKEINQLKEVIESQTSQNQSLIDDPQFQYQQQQQQIELFGAQSQTSGQIVKGSQKNIRKPSTMQISEQPPKPDQKSRKQSDFERQTVSPIEEDTNQIQRRDKLPSYKNEQRKQSISPVRQEEIPQSRQDHSRQPSYKNRNSVSPTEQQRVTHRKQSSAVDQAQIQINQLNDQLREAHHIEDDLNTQINFLNQQLQESKLMIENLDQVKSQQQDQIIKLKQDLQNSIQEIQKQQSINKEQQLQLQKLQRTSEQQIKIQDQKIQENQRRQNLLEKQLQDSQQIIDKLEQESQNMTHKFELEKDDLIKEYEEQLEMKQQEILEVNQSALQEKSKKDEYELQLNQLRAKDANYNAEMEKIKKQKDLFKAQLEETQKSLNQAKLQYSQIESEHSAQVELREQLETNYAILQKEYGEFKENSISQFNNKLNAIQQKSQTEYEKLKKQSGQQLAELEKLQLEKSELEQELNNTQQDLGHQYQEVTQQLQNAKQQLNESKKQVKQLSLQNQQLTQDNQELSVHHQHQEKELNQLRSELQNQSEQCQTLRFDISRIQIDKAQMESARKQDKQIDQLILENESILHTNERLQTDHKQLSDTLQQKDSEIARLKKKVEQLGLLNSGNVEQIKKLQSELSEKETTSDKIQNEFNNYQREIQLLRKENDRLSAETIKHIETLELEKTNAAKRLDSIQTQLQQQIVQRDQDYEELDKSSRSVFVEIQSKKQETQQQQRKIEQQNDQIQQLREQLEKLQTQNKSLYKETSTNKQIQEQQQQEFEFTIKDLQATLQKQQYKQDELEKDLQRSKLHESKQREMFETEKDKMQLMLVEMEEKLEAHKSGTADEKKEFEVLKLTINTLNNELERIRGENSDLHEIIIQLQKENVSLRDHHQQMIVQIEENHQANERLRSLNQQQEQEIILFKRQQSDHFLAEQPKAGFIKTKNTKKLEEIERENLNQQKEIQKLLKIIAEMQNNQNYNSTPTPERKQPQPQLSQRKHLFEQKPKSIDNTIRKQQQ